MYARSTTIEAQPSSIDAGIARVRDEVMPALQAMDGCIGVSLLVDRESGRCIATSAWETEQAMRANAEKVRQVRDRAAETFAAARAAARRLDQRYKSSPISLSNRCITHSPLS